MVHIKDDSTKEITNSYLETEEEDIEYAVIKCDDGHFVYRIPLLHDNYKDEKVLKLETSKMKIIESPSQDKRYEFNGMSDLTVPRKVAEEAENISGASIVE